MPLLTIELRLEHDIVLARQRARQIASLLGFDRQDEVRIATAVSEIARNAYQYARQGKVEFAVEEGGRPALVIRVSDKGKGIEKLEEILCGAYKSKTGMGLGIVGAKRLMDDFQIDASPGRGSLVLLRKYLGRTDPAIDKEAIQRVTRKLSEQVPQNPFEEMQRQNQELLTALDEVNRRTAELAQLNRELEDTNRGVVALYAELDERADYLRRASELKTRFLSNMTHEFRTPLNSILSLSGMLLDRIDGPLTKEQERQVSYIRKGADDLSELVNDLLDLAKVEAGKVTIRPTEFEITELFRALRGMLRPLLAHNESVDLVFEEPEGLPTMHTDESKVSQIVRNFISNALKFTEGGEVRVSARANSKDTVTLSVQDTGIGIPQEDQQRIFEEFAQVEGAHQSRVKGTGLGLPLARKLTQLLGGELTLQSEPGIGSTFSVTLPVSYHGATEVSDVPELQREPDPIRYPILVVDDNRETHFIYEKYLKGSGFQPIPALTVAEARACLARFRPVAIILDILLESGHTWGLLEELKQRRETRDIPLFVVTMVENRHKAIALGANDYCEKPLTREWLLDRLRTHVKQDPPDRILIVDDDEVSRYVLKGLLADTRFSLVEANGGKKGLEMARQIRPTAIILDVMMPDLNGFEVLDQLKSDPATRKIPVIAVTSELLSGEERKRLSRDTVTILSKDHSVREASLAKLREALAASARFRQAPKELPK